jgi:hypothetical protein
MLLGVFSYTMLTGKIPSWPSNVVVNKTVRNTAVDTPIPNSIAFTNTKADGFPGRMYIFRDHALLSYEPVTKKTEKVATLPNSVTTAMMSPNLDVYAYLSTKKNIDTLSMRRRDDNQVIDVAVADHSYASDQEEKSTHFTGPIRFSPDGRFFVVRQASWESIADIVVSVQTGKIIATLTAESLSWSANSTSNFRISR